MPKMHLRQPGFTYNACRPSTKNKERIKNFKETGDSRYIYQNQLDIVCFQHNTVYGDFKCVLRRTVADKVLHDKAFNIAKNSNYKGYQYGFTSMVYNVFRKKNLSGTVKSEIVPNQELAK